MTGGNQGTATVMGIVDEKGISQEALRSWHT
jgi:hypothetical protein